MSDSVIERAEEILDHSGVKGMKWGVRKDGSVSSTSSKSGKLARKPSDVVVRQKPGKFARTAGGTKQTATTDAVVAAATRQLAKKSTTDSLSTKQLKDVVSRMKLEQQYHELAKKSDRRSRGQRFIATFLGDKNTQQKIVKSSGTIKKVAKTISTAAV